MISANDRYFIERKYHDPEQAFDPFKRMAYHGIGYKKETGLSDEELLEGLHALPLEGLPHPVAKGIAFTYLLQNERIYFNEHDYFVGLYSLDRLAKCVTFSKWAEESLALRDPAMVELSKDVNECGAMMYWTDYDHVVPDWSSLMELGFTGIRQRARDYREKHRERGTLTAEKEAFFEGIELQYTAILELLDRMIAIGEKESFEKAAEITECLKGLRQGAPQSFYQALQLIYIYFLTSECIDRYQVRSLGNGLDRTLYPFYKADLESGKYTEEDLRHYLSYFLMQWSAIGNYWGQPFYLGGTKPDGSTRYNELSRMILEVYDQLEIYNPKIQLKVNENTPEWLLKKAFDMIRRKNASLVFCCEPGMIRAVMGYGATFEEALDFDLRGCYETGVRAGEVCSTSGYINAAKAIEYVFSNGFDTTLNKQIGVKTGELTELTTFEDFYFAFLKQWGNLVDIAMKITCDAEKFLDFVNPSSLYSATIAQVLEKGEDGYGGGIKFSNNGMLNCSFASAVDSVLAVKEFVYEKKEVSLTRLAEILKNNWEGEALLRAKIRKSPHKYGNNDPIADTYAAAMAHFFANKVNNVPNEKGGVFKAQAHSARAFIRHGAKTGATPDGRLAGEELSKNADPVMGMDKKGVTATISSALKLRPEDFHESFCLGLMLHPGSVQGEEGYAVLKGLLMTYLKGNGQSLQFNIFSPETLRDAQKNPEKYKNLQVRVCGWNTLWNNMSKEEQDAYVLRAENLQ